MVNNIQVESDVTVRGIRDPNDAADYVRVGAALGFRVQVARDGGGDLVVRLVSESAAYAPVEIQALVYLTAMADGRSVDAVLEEVRQRLVRADVDPAEKVRGE